VTWEHEMENSLGDADAPRMLTIDAPSAIPSAVAQLALRAAS
jgi:putative hydrolase of the HAD superfamily